LTGCMVIRRKCLICRTLAGSAGTASRTVAAGRIRSVCPDSVARRLCCGHPKPPCGRRWTLRCAAKMRLGQDRGNVISELLAFSRVTSWRPLWRVSILSTLVGLACARRSRGESEMGNGEWGMGSSASFVAKQRFWRHNSPAHGGRIYHRGHRGHGGYLSKALIDAHLRSSGEGIHGLPHSRSSALLSGTLSIRRGGAAIW
jgi:hypothetical protein